MVAQAGSVACRAVHLTCYAISIGPPAWGGSIMPGFRGEQPHIETAAVCVSFGSLVVLSTNLILPPHMGSAVAAESRTNVAVAK